jgi:hypothetical protein
VERGEICFVVNSKARNFYGLDISSARASGHLDWRICFGSPGSEELCFRVKTAFLLGTGRLYWHHMLLPERFARLGDGGSKS